MLLLKQSARCSHLAVRWCVVVGLLLLTSCASRPVHVYYKGNHLDRLRIVVHLRNENDDLYQHNAINEDDVYCTADGSYALKNTVQIGKRAFDNLDDVINLTSTVESRPYIPEEENWWIRWYLGGPDAAASFFASLAGHSLNTYPKIPEEHKQDPSYSRNATLDRLKEIQNERFDVRNGYNPRIKHFPPEMVKEYFLRRIETIPYLELHPLDRRSPLREFLARDYYRVIRGSGYKKPLWEDTDYHHYGSGLSADLEQEAKDFLAQEFARQHRGILRVLNVTMYRNNYDHLNAVYTDSFDEYKKQQFYSEAVPIADEFFYEANPVYIYKDIKGLEYTVDRGYRYTSVLDKNNQETIINDFDDGYLLNEVRIYLLNNGKLTDEINLSQNIRRSHYDDCLLYIDQDDSVLGMLYSCAPYTYTSVKKFCTAEKAREARDTIVSYYKKQIHQTQAEKKAVYDSLRPIDFSVLDELTVQ